MGRLARVGLDKLLIGLTRVVPLLGTIEGIGEAPPTLLMTKLRPRAEQMAASRRTE
jgi:hypothetical protein